MDSYPIEVKEKLNSLIDDIANVSWVHRTDPGHNFSRSRKLDFADTLRLIISMDVGTVNEEIMEFFHYNQNHSPTQSAAHMSNMKLSSSRSNILLVPISETSYTMDIRFWPTMTLMLFMLQILKIQRIT